MKFTPWLRKKIDLSTYISLSSPLLLGGFSFLPVAPICLMIGRSLEFLIMYLWPQKQMFTFFHRLTEPSASFYLSDICFSGSNPEEGLESGIPTDIAKISYILCNAFRSYGNRKLHAGNFIMDEKVELGASVLLELLHTALNVTASKT